VQKKVVENDKKLIEMEGFQKLGEVKGNRIIYKDSY